MAKFLYEFLYRGRAPGDDTPPEYHVVLGDAGTDVFGKPTLALSDPMTPDQAEQAGFPVPSIVSGINSGFQASVDALTAEVASSGSQITSLQFQLAAAQAALTAEQTTVAALVAQISDAKTKAAALKDVLEAPANG